MKSGVVDIDDLGVRDPISHLFLENCTRDSVGKCV
jgi:hypothetical protein